MVPGHLCPCASGAANSGCVAGTLTCPVCPFVHLSPPFPSALRDFQGIPSQLLSLHPQGDVWICMELMDTSLDKFYKKVLEKKKTIPEDILGKMAVSVSASWILTWFCPSPEPVGGL